MSFDDFCRLTVDEFNETAKAFNDFTEAEYKNSWERSRLVMYYSALGPHLSPNKLKGKTPQKLLPLAWDNKPSARKRKTPVKGDRERFNALLEKYGRKYHGKEDKAKQLTNG